MTAIARIILNEGDRVTPPRIRLLESDGSGKDVSTWTFTFTMKLLGSATAKVNAQECQLTNAGTDGRVHYAWGETDLDIPGTYVGWFTGSVGGISVSYPQGGSFIIEVRNLP